MRVSDIGTNSSSILSKCYVITDTTSSTWCILLVTSLGIHSTVLTMVRITLPVYPYVHAVHSTNKCCHMYE